MKQLTDGKAYSPPGTGGEYVIPFSAIDTQVEKSKAILASAAYHSGTKNGCCA
jgi:hypothetical protein